MVNSSHHQAIDAVGVGPSWCCSLDRLEDGVVEAVEDPDRIRWLVGVQWHPERTFEHAATVSQAIFDKFVAGGEPRPR